ncbi:hypothetical protein N7499_007324 [Penicillium canescens]|nr:hypothetical protein N7499_007324 [Penicillium canescens]
MASSGKKVRFMDESQSTSRAPGPSVYEPSQLIADEPEPERRGPPDFSRQSPRVRWNLSALIASFLYDQPQEVIVGVINGTEMIVWDEETIEHFKDMIVLWVKHKVPGDAIGVFLIYVLYDFDIHLNNMLTKMVDESFSNFDIAWNVTNAHCGDSASSQLIMYDDECIIDSLMGHVEEESETPSQEGSSASVGERPSLFDGVRIPFLDTDELTDEKIERLLEQPGDTPEEEDFRSRYPIPKIVLMTSRSTQLPRSASEDDLSLPTEIPAGMKSASTQTDFDDDFEYPITSSVMYSPTIFQQGKGKERKPQVTRLPLIEGFKADIVQADDHPDASSSKKPSKPISGSFLYRKIRTCLSPAGFRRQAGKDHLRKEYLKGEKK